MRKEIFLAIFIGILIGVLVAFGAWRANSALKPVNSDEPLELTRSETPENTTETKSNPLLSLVNLDHNEVVSENPYKVTGITGAGNILAISGETEDYILKAASDGSFEQEIKLTPGVNQILFNVLDSEKNIYEEKVIVVFSEDFAKSI